MLKTIWFFSLIISTMFFHGCKRGKSVFEIKQDSIKMALAEVPLDENGRVAKQRPYSEPFHDSIQQRKLLNGSNSYHELFENIIHSLTNSDTLNLRKQLVTESEYRKWLWVEFSESRSIMNLPPSLAWDILTDKSEANLRELLRKFKNIHLSIDSIKFLEKKNEYQTFYFLQKPVLYVSARNKKIKIEDFGSVLVLNGQYKLLSYGN